MNMMDAAHIDAAASDSWEKRGALKACLRSGVEQVYSDGFRAGVAWAQRQAKSEASPQAVGTTYAPAVEDPEEEVVSTHRCLVEPDQPWPRR